MQGEVAAVEIDLSVAHAARIYDYWLGGSTNFEVDRQAADAAAEAHPGGLATMRASVASNRAYLARSVAWLAEERGITQFLDIGSGVPHGDNVHTIARRITPEVRVVYVDCDPIVLAHVHELLAGTDVGTVGYLHGDLRDPQPILDQAADTLDFARPVAVLLVGVLHLLSDADDPLGLVAVLVDAVPPESHLVISHLAADIHPDEMTQVQDRLNQSTAETWQLRTRPQVRSLFAGLDLVEPGIVAADLWHPHDQPRPVPAPEGRTNPLWVGVGRKP